MSSTQNLTSLQDFDRHVEQVIFTADCTAWNEKRSTQILAGLLFIVKRTTEPRFQIILQPIWPVNTHADRCGFCLAESFDQNGHFEVWKPKFVLPSQGFVVFFNNLEDSTHAADCIKGLVDTTAPTGSTLDTIEEQRDATTDPTIPTIAPTGSTPDTIEEQRDTTIDPSFRIDVSASDTPENNNAQVWDEKIYLQNTRVIMAMIAVLLATIVLSFGLNPPSSVSTLAVKILFQIMSWIAAIFSLAALFILGVVTPTSFEMQGRIFRCGFFAISVALVCVLVAFGATTIFIATNIFTCTTGLFIGAIGVVMFSYFTSKTVRHFIFSFLKFRLTQNGDDSAYSITSSLC